MKNSFLRFYVLLAAITICSNFSTLVFAEDNLTKPVKPNNNEITQIEKIVFPEFNSFSPKIIDTKAFAVLKVIHLSVKAADHSDAFVVLTPENKVIDIDNYALLSNIDIKKNPNYAKLAEKYPNISIWPGNHDYPKFEKLADGALQLQFNYRLLNGCHACAVGGVAVVGFNFDVKGDFINTTLIDLLPPSVSDN
jgi:hypothetical protein